MQTCLLIGARGFVGQAMAAEAISRGWVVQLANRENYGEYVGRDFDVVINANGNAKRFLANRDPWSDFMASAESVYRSCLDFRCRHYTYISTVDVYNDPADRASTRESSGIDPLRLAPYAFHKWLAERFVMRRPGQWQVIRLAQMVGPGLRKGPVLDLLHGKPLRIHDDSRLHFMRTSQVARAACDLIARGAPNEIFNVCGQGGVAFGWVRELLEPLAAAPAPPVDDVERQCYDIDTSKTDASIGLPESESELRAFAAEVADSRQSG